MQEKKDICENIKLCPVQKTLNIIWWKWKIIILWHLLENTLRTSEIKNLIPQISQKMLIAQLKELEKENIIQRKVYPVVPPKVEYSLTPLGLTLKPILEQMQEWWKKID